MLKKRIKNNLLRSIIEWIIAVLIALLLFLIIDNFVVKVARVEGASMHPTFSNEDRVLINRLVYFFGEPQFGDIIAFPYAANPSKHYIKRIIGVPFDIIDYINGFIYINGEKLEDEFSDLPFYGGNAAFPIELGEDEFFVLGDNRNGSEDSRSTDVGNIRREDIIGRVRFRWFPLSRIGFAN